MKQKAVNTLKNFCLPIVRSWCQPKQTMWRQPIHLLPSTLACRFEATAYLTWYRLGTTSKLKVLRVFSFYIRAVLFTGSNSLLFISLKSVLLKYFGILVFRR